MRALVLAFMALSMRAAMVDASGTKLTPRDHEQVRMMYLKAVESAGSLSSADSTVARLRSRTQPGSRDDAILIAYSGAIRTLRAKHGRWPPARLKNLRDGLRAIDGVVRTHPDVPEIRYLRLMSCYYLPGMLGRGWSVSEDFSALAVLLPPWQPALSPDLYRAVATFVLREAELTGEQRRMLEPTLSP